MNYRILLTLSILCLTASSILAVEQSLFDAQNARKLDTTEVQAFGPKAKSFRYDKTMLNAARIAAERAHAHSTSSCWRYVKQALLAAKTIESYPKTEFAKEAGAELTMSYGFRKLHVTDPFRAPLGAVIVYGGAGAGHVEIRTELGFVSDFISLKPSPRPLIGVFVKPPPSA